MEGIFSSQKINTGRQRELDFAKGLAVLFMVFVHGYEVFHSEALMGSTYSRVIEFLGSPPAAPVFMFLLGLGIVYSRRNDAKSLFKRGCTLFSLGYVLNFFRESIPYMILAFREQDITYIEEAWHCLWGVDILPFAGLTFIFFACVKKFKLNHYWLVACWCLFTELHILVRGTLVNHELLNYFCRLFWAVDDYSWFPFLNWISFPILGYLFGQLLIRCRDKKQFYSILLVGNGALSLPLWSYAYLNNIRFGAFGELYQYDYYNHDLIGTLILCSFALMWLSICFFVHTYIPETIFKWLSRWSKYINELYCIHWLLLGALMPVLSIDGYGALGVFVISLIVFIVSDGFCFYLKQPKEVRKLALSS